MSAVQDSVFLSVIEQTPLVSIDLIVNNSAGAVLLGFRNNRPAQHNWFVPGGRIRKNETISQALARISQQELGVSFTPGQGRLLGTYDHIYPDNYAGVDNINTHYVVMAYQFDLSRIALADFQPVVDAQHERFQWWQPAELLASDVVHDNTKAYFR